MLHNPKHLWSHFDFLSGLVRGQCPCLRLLAEGVRQLVVAQSGGLVLCGRDRTARVCFGVPSRNAIARVIEGANTQRAIGQAMCVSDDAGAWAGKHVFAGRDHKEHELLFIRLPDIFERAEPGITHYLCFLDRMIRESPATELKRFYIEPLVSIVHTWAAHVVRTRTALFWDCQRMRDDHDQMGREVETTSLRLRVEHLRRMLSLRDVVDVIEALQMTDGDRDTPLKDIPPLLSGVLGEDLAEWHNCVPPRWPPTCAGCGGDVVPRDLVKWAVWRNIDVGRIHDHREDLIDSVLPLFDQLMVRARKAVEPKVNLLPAGLQAFVLSRGTDQFVRQRGAFWTSPGPTDEELATAIMSVARVAHTVLGGLPVDDRAIQGMIWLLCEYAHHALGVPQQIDLRAHLLQAARGEPALHVLKSFYRDHFFHALEVCFLGHFLLELQISTRQPLWRLVAQKLKLQGTTQENHQTVLRLWYIASLLHDVGYGIDVLKGLQSLLRFFGHTEPLRDLSERLSADLTQLSKDLEEAGLADYTAADKPGEDHGVIAAWHLETLLQAVGKDDKTVICRDYWPAIRAIAKHNSRKHDVAFSEDPLAFLLILCDTIQEWNRPRFSFATSAVQILSRLMDQWATPEQWASPLDTACLNVNRSTARRPFELARSGTLRFTLTFNDLIRWNGGVFTLWLDASCNLQRLKFDGLPRKFKIEIQYRTPLFQKSPGASPEQQLYRLRDAASETHMTFLGRWFPQSARRGRKGNTNGGVTWVPGETKDGATQMESLTLHLRRLSEMRPITGSIEEFRKRLTKWKRFNEDREFGGDYGAPETVP